EISNFEQIFYKLLMLDKIEIDVDRVYKELIIIIKVNTESEYQILAPNIVILEPSSNSYSDKAVHKTYSMFFDDVEKKLVNEIK
ncbi:3008_t:CDS:1, partial [Cetraspora pellucida]